MPQEKLPPFHANAEEAVIGCLLLRGTDVPASQFLAEILPECGGLKPSDFFREKNDWCFQAILDLAHQGAGVDQITLAYRLQSTDKLEPIGGPGYLIHCLSLVATSYHLKYYAAIVLETSRLRKQIAEGVKLIKTAYDPATPPSPPKHLGPVKGL